ncbi:sulfate adenylyltransferase subunit 1 [Conexibacter sp. S30A1]|uniref:sulfate adenylyltransferase subunit 1 n=1 Tax=Conexibacter sp. S30A1 TaxID=2937800 RepID=UPI00200D5B15|nr:GTP-binding protein [Conexibacter sp. S30A1]
MPAVSELLRVATAGSVDDGKSTLIGRLLHDTKSILEDQLAHVAETSERRGDGYVNLALLTDGLRAEREQGITIDVAYRYFQTGAAAGTATLDTGAASFQGGRKFIIADTPGHEQYTRNMVTGASTADLSIVLIDARHGVSEQTRRHAYITSLLRIPHLVVAVNKMDLVDYSQETFEAIVAEFTDWATRLALSDVSFIPLSALRGDNVVERSDSMPWYQGPSLLYHLEHVVIATDRDMDDVRFPVQWVVRPMSDEHHDYRGYAGQVAAGVIRPGSEVLVLPSGRRTRVAAIDTYDGALELAFPTMSVTLRLEDDIDISRGDLIAGADEPPIVARDLEAMVCWMSEQPMRAGGRYAIHHTTRAAKAIIDRLEYRVDVNTLERDTDAGTLELNEIGRVHLRSSTPLVVDPYARNRTTGSFILIDEATNDTVAAGMIRSAR